MNKISNFHTHTKLCRHAEGMPYDYLMQAAKDGCSALGFSDHCPYPDDNAMTWPEIRMSVNEVDLYFRQIREISYKFDFPVYTGFECEWDKNYENWYRDVLLGEYKADYLVLGSHWLTEGERHIYTYNFSDCRQMNSYIDQTIDGIRSGLYKFVAHPDLFMGQYKKWDSQAKSCSKALLDACVDCDVPIEINGLGMTRQQNLTENGLRFQYPYREFWEMTLDSGVKILCNSDAHKPCDVILNARLARSFAEELGIKIIDSIFEEF